MSELGSWFPLRCDLFSEDEFRSLRYTEAVALLHLQYQIGEHLSLVDRGFRQAGPFVVGDEKQAQVLAMSVQSYRNARKKLRQLGWLECRSGYRTEGGDHRATSYFNARYAQTEHGVRCAVMPRATWWGLITSLRAGHLTHQDVTACAFLLYLWKVAGGRTLSHLTVDRCDVRRLTGMRDRAFVMSLKRLQQTNVSTLSFEIKCSQKQIRANSLFFSLKEEPELSEKASVDSA